MEEFNILHVAVGVVINAQAQILVALRGKHVEQGGLWEFPGGKVESGETVQQALARELYEEVGLTVHAATPLIQIEHQYPNKKVLLDIWHVEKFSGNPRVCEKQLAIRWVNFAELLRLPMPAANYKILETIGELLQNLD